MRTASEPLRLTSCTVLSQVRTSCILSIINLTCTVLSQCARVPSSASTVVSQASPSNQLTNAFCVRNIIVISAIYNIKAIRHYYNHSYPEPRNNNADPAEPLPGYTEPERGIPRPVPPPRQSVLHTPRDSARAAAIRTRRSSSPEGQGNAEDLFG